MKKFTSCPICKSKMLGIATGRLYEERCDMLAQAEGCPIGFRRYFHESLADEDIAYIVFCTANFRVYHYYQGNFHYYDGDKMQVDNETHVYHRTFPRGQDVQSPIFKLKNLSIDFDRLRELDDKFKKLNIFT